MSLKTFDNPWITEQAYNYSDLETNYDMFDLEGFCYYVDVDEKKKGKQQKDSK